MKNLEDVYESTYKRISRDELLMEIAKTVALRSTCSRAQVGCVVSKEGRVLTMGYNGAPAGMLHCIHVCNCSAKGQAMGQRIPHADGCPAGDPCLISVHAECNAIAWAARTGVALEGGEMFTTVSPCTPCAQLIINSGIVKVTYAKTYRDLAGVELLSKAYVRVQQGVKVS